MEQAVRTLNRCMGSVPIIHHSSAPLQTSLIEKEKKKCSHHLGTLCFRATAMNLTLSITINKGKIILAVGGASPSWESVLKFPRTTTT